MWRVLAFCLCLLVASAAQAQTETHYVRDGGSCTNNCHDWSNAYDQISTVLSAGDLSRGDTIYVADGTYSNVTLNTATSGTSTITIKKATASDHGTETNWQSTYGDGEAVLGEIFVATRYWIVDGQTRTYNATWTAASRGSSAYGFRVAGISADSLSGDDADFSEFRYVDIGPAYTTSYSSGWSAPIRFVYDQTDITFSHCAVHNGIGALFQGAGADNITFEYCDIGPGWGKEALRGGNGSVSSGWTVQYNRFWRSSQIDPDDGTSGITAEIAIWDFTGSCSGHVVHGNWFFNDQEGARNALIVIGGGEGGWVGDGCTGTIVDHNTMAGIADDGVYSMIDLNGTGTRAQNNLWYDCASTSISASTTNTNVVAVADPFQDYANLDLRLSGATTAGTTVSSPYDVDALGVTRGVDGTWDVGAYEYDAGGGGGGGSIGGAGSRLRLRF